MRACQLLCSEFLKGTNILLDTCALPAVVSMLNVCLGSRISLSHWSPVKPSGQLQVVTLA